jgi:hypothetical protein
MQKEQVDLSLNVVIHRANSKNPRIGWSFSSIPESLRQTSFLASV